MNTATDAGIAAAYDARATEYAELLGSIGQMDEQDVEAIAAWRDATPSLLLDAGCGPGHWTEFLSRGGREARGIDLSEQIVAAARGRHPGIAYEVGTFRDLPFRDGSVGGILAWYSLIHTPPAELPGILAEFGRVLAPGGGILIGFFDGEPGEPFAHAVAPSYFWSGGALSMLLRDAGFDRESAGSRERRPGEVSVRPHGSLVARRR